MKFFPHCKELSTRVDAGDFFQALKNEWITDSGRCYLEAKGWGLDLVVEDAALQFFGYFAPFSGG